VRTDNGTVRVYRNFTDYKAFKTSFANDSIFGGRLLAIKSKEFITFYDWDDFNVVRRIDVPENIKQLYWSEDGTQLILVLETTFYLLQFKQEEVEKAFAAENQDEDEEEDGVEAAFDMLDEFPDIIMSGLWVSNECFTFINAKGNIIYLINGRMMKLGNAEKKQFILGYEGKQNRLYLIDKSLKVVAHRLMLSVLNYQAAILLGDDKKAETLIA